MTCDENDQYHIMIYLVLFPAFRWNAAKASHKNIHLIFLMDGLIWLKQYACYLRSIILLVQPSLLNDGVVWGIKAFQ